jgi:hypothetical protein
MLDQAIFLKKNETEVYKKRVDLSKLRIEHTHCKSSVDRMRKRGPALSCVSCKQANHT